MPSPLCFVLMPFGTKPGPSGAPIDFDAVYRDVIHGAVKDADLEPIRADEERVGGIVHKPMFERLVLCDYAVADLTTANCNVFYELGVRHAVRKHSTELVFANGVGRLPFDVAPLRGMPYELGADGRPSRAATDRAQLAKKLVDARHGYTDSPLYQLLDDYPQVRHEKTDVFREQVEYSRVAKERLEGARRVKPDPVRALRDVEASLPPLRDVEAGVAVDLLLSYRDVKAWSDVIRIAESMPAPLARTVLVQEQLGFALNRAGRSEDAERVLRRVIDAHGPSSETNGLLGRVYKDRWESASKSGDEIAARGYLKRAVDAYVAGFESDWRDAYPGINAVTLMELSEPPDPRRVALLPVVAFAVERRLASRQADYWDHATALEIAVLRRDESAAVGALESALASARNAFEPETSARNLSLIRGARERRGDVTGWEAAIGDALVRRAREFPSAP